MLHATPVRALSRGSLMSRRRIQFFGALISAALLPYLLRRLFWPGTGGEASSLNALTGNGVSEQSQVGILAAPLILEIGTTGLTKSDTSGQRTANRKIAVITQGSKGLKVAATGGGGLNYSQQVGRLSWRQMNNYQENKNN